MNISTSHCNVTFLEHVVITLNLNFTKRSHLEVNITSPQGTRALLIHTRGFADSFSQKMDNFSVLSLHHWGENPNGIWTIVFGDGKNQESNSGKQFEISWKT